MKKLLIIPVLAISSLVAAAAPPNLSVESLFGRKDLRREGYEISFIQSEGNYYRSISAANDPKLLEQVRLLVDKDSKRASNVVHRFAGGEEKIVMQVPNGTYIINIGFTISSPGEFRLFVQGDPKAFE